MECELRELLHEAAAVPFFALGARTGNSSTPYKYRREDNSSFSYTQNIEEKGFHLFRISKLSKRSKCIVFVY